jgi:cytidylate kinase
MIVWITGPSASGKSTINFKVVEELGVGYKNKKHSVDFYEFNDIIIIGRYSNSGRTLNGTDGVMVGKDKLKKFIDIEYLNWRHILMDGSKFVNEEILDHLLNYNTKIFYLNAPMDKIISRSQERNNGWDKQNTLQKREKEIKKYDTLFNMPKYIKNIEVRQNLNMEDSKKISNEILKLFSPINKIKGLPL